jgi:hypothetical protein
VEDAVVSPDGKNLYVVGSESDTVVVFARNTGSGRVRQLRGPRTCVSRRRRDGCTTGRALLGPVAVVVSHDGRNVYVTDEDDGVAVFARERRSGTLAQLPGRAGRLARDGRDGCALVPELRAGRAAVAPDDRNLYVASAAFDSNAVIAFARSARNGALTRLPGAAGRTRSAVGPGYPGARVGKIPRPLRSRPTERGRSLHASRAVTMAHLSGRRRHSAASAPPFPALSARASMRSRPPPTPS